ncbi:MAG TPA: hypothetical protein VGL61_03985 [Kofleriaceae bacterium]|jgi:hypothetical protein
MNPTKKTDEQTTTIAPTKKDPKRCVEAIETDHLENVVGGVGDSVSYPRRMVTDA